MSAARAAARFAAKCQTEVSVSYTEWAAGYTEHPVDKHRIGTGTAKTRKVQVQVHSPDYAKFGVRNHAGFPVGALIVDAPPATVAFLDDAAIEGVVWTYRGNRYTTEKLPGQMTPLAMDADYGGTAVVRTLILVPDRGQ
jgi:hypothetical protein